MGRMGIGCLAVLAALTATAAAWGQSTGQAASPPPSCPADDCGMARWAVPSDTGRYTGYWVGGGSAFHGDPREPTEGVWGWDYSGACFVPRIARWWNHGRYYQGGPGAYRPDGPRFIEEHKEKKGE